MPAGGYWFLRMLSQVTGTLGQPGNGSIMCLCQGFTSEELSLSNQSVVILGENDDSAAYGLIRLRMRVGRVLAPRSDQPNVLAEN